MWVTHAKLFNVSTAYLSLVAAGFVLTCVWSDRWVLRIALPIGWFLIWVALAKRLSDRYLSKGILLRGSSLSLPSGLKRTQVPINSLESIGGNPLPFCEKHIVFLSFIWTTGDSIVPAVNGKHVHAEIRHIEEKRGRKILELGTPECLDYDYSTFASYLKSNPTKVEINPALFRTFRRLDRRRIQVLRFLRR